LSILVTALVIAFGAFTSAQAQSDPFVAQFTSSGGNSFVNDISGDSRFLIVESNGDIGTKEPALGLNPDNSDLNREIFLIDYAQRRIFQLTNTKHRLADTALSPVLNSNIVIEISNNAPVISNDGRYVAFFSNANSLTPSGTNTSTPGNFDGNNLSNADRDALLADANWEIWIYEIPVLLGPPPTLSSGIEAPFQDLSLGTFLRVTNTPSRQIPQPGTATEAPTISADNRAVTINDDGSLVAFISNRAFPGSISDDNNPEVFTHLRTAAVNSVSQITATPTGSVASPISSSNPSLSGSGARVTFISNANIIDTGQTTGNNSDANAEIYIADLDAAGVRVGNKQVTRTVRTNPGDIINILSPGRRISRDGNLIAFESAADLNSASPGPNASTSTVFIYNVTANTFTKVGARGADDTVLGGDVLRFPVFTDYVGTTPGALVFTSRLNFKPDGTIPTTASEGLNPTGDSLSRPFQIYSVSLPIGMTLAISRLSKIPEVAFFFASAQPVASNSRTRISFSLSSPDLGGLNIDNSAEVFYLLTPAPIPISDGNVADSYLTGATLRSVGPVPSPTPTPTPTPTPSPSPSPSPTPTPVTPMNVPGVAPGMIAVVQFPNRVVFPTSFATSASTRRSPSLPIELDGISVSVSNFAAGLYSVQQRRIVFVVPPGLAAAAAGTNHPVVINIKGHILRGSILLVPAQPDISTTTNGPGGRANVINAATGTPEAFTVFTVRPRRPRSPTVLRIFLTGVAGAPAGVIAVKIGSVTLSGSAIRSGGTATEMPGIQHIDVQLPPELAGAGDVPIIVIVTTGGLTFASRLEDTAPHITIL
jgi:uncharacterized protein (TIGR03437 family)